MIFQHTLGAVLNGTKTQTRRAQKIGERFIFNDDDNRTHIVLGQGGRVKWRVGDTYAVQPGRGEKQVARIRITDIRSEFVTDISEGDAIAEGFQSQEDFLETWIVINGQFSQCWVISFELIEEHNGV